MAKWERVEESPWRTWLTLVGIIPFYGSIGFAMTGYINFDLGIAVLCLTAAIFAVHFWLANKVQSRRFRASGVIAIFVGSAVTLWLVFVPAPLVVLIDAPPENYAEGQQIFGLEWKKTYFPINITVRNDTSLTYDNADFYFRTDKTFIARAAVSGHLNTCEAAPENSAIAISQATFSTKDVSIPLFEDDKQFPASIYRVRCDKISPRSHVDIILAIEDATKPAWAVGSFRFDATNRHRGPIYSQKCFIGSCRDMPQAAFTGG
jgi:hypothetical protein